MYTDWFAAGKGPDPVAASLDKEMDSYFDSKKGFEEQGASQEEVPKTEEVPAATSETAWLVLDALQFGYYYKLLISSNILKS